MQSVNGEHGSLMDKWYPSCTVCPHRCGVDRISGQTGICGTDEGIYVASSQLHFGEERVLVGRGGSGTIFFASCNLKCVFCQNSSISMCVHPSQTGRRLNSGEFSRLVWQLRIQGAENINLVTPTHMGPAVFDVIRGLRAGGMKLPIVYNCGGYENADFIRDLEGLVDIYMPDIKFGTDEAGSHFTTAEDYFSRCREAVLEMHRQVGDLSIGPAGTARRGLLVRHLVLPGIEEDAEGKLSSGGMAESDRVIDFIAEELSRNTYVNIMDQYFPAYQARNYRGIGRRLSPEEHQAVIKYAKYRGLHRFAG